MNKENVIRSWPTALESTLMIPNDFIYERS